MDMKKNIKKYVELILKTGLRIKAGDKIVMLVSEQSIPIVRELSKQAYNMGVVDIAYEFSDDDITLNRFLLGKDTCFTEYSKAKADYIEALYKEGYHRLALVAPNPDLLKPADPKRIGKWQSVSAKALKKAMDCVMQNEVKWTVAAVATPEWAKLVFPNLEITQAVEKLWENIFSICRVTADDPIATWKKHDDSLKAYQNKLNELQLVKMTYIAPDTNLEVHLPKGHIWLGGSGKTQDGEVFMPNLPTEEVFSLPHAYKINGTLKATKPLSVRGQIVDKFNFTFKDGKIVDFDAKIGKKILEDLINTDEGASRLGEIAIVAHDSPISNTGLLFNNTLFDENASCHFALGAAYTETLKESVTLSEDEKKARGFNQSLIHVDFMVGSADLTIIGEKADGSEVTILKDGNWAF